MAKMKRQTIPSVSEGVEEPELSPLITQKKVEQTLWKSLQFLKKVNMHLLLSLEHVQDGDPSCCVTTGGPGLS